MSLELKRVSSIPNDQHNLQQSRKQPRKTENPTRIPQGPDLCADTKVSDPLICKNSTCRANISPDDAFCRRCSCCICHSFDENKDPSLWLECDSGSRFGHSCGLSCHVECALDCGKAGVIHCGPLMQLDGSYCCVSCGKVSGILRCWTKQISIAKEARCVDVLCHRIFLSYRLLDGTSRFSELHEIVREAKAKLEMEVGPLNGDSAKMDRGIVGRLSVAVEVQSLCSLAVQKADQLIASKSTSKINLNEGSLLPACNFLFEEVTSSSVVILLIKLSTVLDDDIKGYKLWYCKTRDETYPTEPSFIFPRHHRRICISNLKPHSEYSFRITSHTDTGDFGHSESKCFTNSIDVFQENPNSQMPDVESDTGFKIRDLGRILNSSWIQEHGLNVCNPVKVEEREEKSPPASYRLDLNVTSVPDLNEEADDAFSQDIHQAPAVNSGILRKRSCDSSTREMQDSDSTLTNDLCLDENFEYCVKIIRWLECEGHIKKDFRLKLLTWFSLRSNEQERRVVNTFIQTLIDDPSSLAGQLVDSFSDVSSKKQRNGFCSIS